MYCHPIDLDFLSRSIGCIHRQLFKSVQRVNAINDMAEYRVLAIQVLVCLVGDEELATCGQGETTAGMSESGLVACRFIENLIFSIPHSKWAVHSIDDQCSSTLPSHFVTASHRTASCHS